MLNRCLYTPFRIRIIVAFLLMLTGGYQYASAQSRTDPSDYMDYITERYDDLSVKFYQYMSAIAHFNNPNKIEKERAELLSLSWQTYSDVRSMPSFKGNTALRDSAAAFMKINHFILKDDFDKILKLEAISADSYNEMEAYILAQRSARNRLDAANARMLAEQQKFADQHGIKLVQRNDATFRKMREANEVLRYLDDVYLAFFRSHLDEVNLLEYIKLEDSGKMTAGSAQLRASAADGLAFLETLRPPDGDAALQHACAGLLRFYRDEAEGLVSDLEAFRQAEAKFAGVKSAYDAMEENMRDAETVRSYNEAVREMNAAVNAFNSETHRRNEMRKKLLQEWQSAFDNYLSGHIPKF